MAITALTLRNRYAALYIRVSTTDQGERYSPGSQQAKLLAKAAADGLTVRPEHIFIDKHTGKETARPAFERLRALVRSGAVQVVLVLCVDRFSRKVHDAAMVAAEFKRHNCLLDFVEMKNDDSPEGRLQFNIMASMAEYMGEKIVERGKDGQQRMLDDNLIPGGVPAYGYDAPEKGKRAINEREAAVVLEMFYQRDGGKSPYSIAMHYNQRGVLSKGYNDQPPAQWSRNTVLQLLKNRQYIGEYHTRGRILEVPAIVPRDLFLRVQAKMAAEGQRWVGRPSNKILLRNFLHCGKCRHRYNGHSKGPNAPTVYRCDYRTNKPPQKRLCDAPEVRAVALEAAVWGMIWFMLKNPALLLSQARAYYASLPKPKRATGSAAMEKELATLKRAVANKTKMLKSGHLDWDEEKGAMLDMKRRIQFLEAELSAIAPVVQLPPERVVAAYLREITIGEEPGNYTERRRILEGLEELRIDYLEKEFVITGRVPFGPPAVESAPYGRGNCERRLSAASNSPLSIPFILKGRVA
jgi:DNA invertase Pin-like site-specific DNA recombinase